MKWFHRPACAIGFLIVLGFVDFSGYAATPAPEAVDTAVPEAVDTAVPEAESVAPELYKIWLSFPLTGGDLAVYGDSASKAALLAQEQINAAGGINGVPIEVVIEDDRCDGEGSLTSLNKISSEGIPVVTGFFCSSAVLAIAIATRNRSIVQYVIGSNPKIWVEDGCGPTPSDTSAMTTTRAASRPGWSWNRWGLPKSAWSTPTRLRMGSRTLSSRPSRRRRYGADRDWVSSRTVPISVPRLPGSRTPARR